ncbi:MAG: fimbrillin family protein [Dysgonamonadaceae bacterium]|jgi:hypothetical protein|nr:fimbrillin family protein [Dysgonamonadaceae bacterium]
MRTKMKNKMTKCTGKLWMIAAIAAMTFASCSTEEIMDTPEATSEELALNFSSYVGNPTLRASEMSQNSLKSTGFNVIAWKTEAANWDAASHATTPDFMPVGSTKGVAVLWGSDRWSYTPVKYWPGKYNATDYGKVSFFGYSPVSAVTSLETPEDANPKLTVTIPNANADQKDLVADMLPNQAYNTSYGRVNFAFDHLLSKIHFAAKLAYDYGDNVEVNLTKLSITYVENQIKNTGTYTFTETNTGTGLWSLGTTYMSGTDVIFTAGEGAGPELSHTPYPPLEFTEIYNLILLPQAAPASGMTASLSYTVTTDGATIPYSVFVGLPAITWLPGKQYTYIFNLSLNSVEFDTEITVGGWTDAGSPGEVSVP